MMLHMKNFVYFYCDLYINELSHDSFDLMVFRMVFGCVIYHETRQCRVRDFLLFWRDLQHVILGGCRSHCLVLCGIFAPMGGWMVRFMPFVHNVRTLKVEISAIRTESEKKQTNSYFDKQW